MSSAKRAIMHFARICRNNRQTSTCHQLLSWWVNLTLFGDPGDIAILITGALDIEVPEEFGDIGCGVGDFAIAESMNDEGDFLEVIFLIHFAMVFEVGGVGRVDELVGIHMVQWHEVRWNGSASGATGLT